MASDKVACSEEYRTVSTYNMPRAKNMLMATFAANRMCNLHTMNCGNDQINESYTIVQTALAMYVFSLTPLLQCPPRIFRSQL